MMAEPTETQTAPETRAANRKFLMEIAFDGTEFHGWQYQPNGLAVQEVIETKLRGLFGGADIKLFGAGRTDAGVHALGFAAHFSAPESPYIPDWKIHKALNRLLPPLIRIVSFSRVDDPDFHARFSAAGKTYVYVINNGAVSPFTARYSWHLPNCDRVDEMRRALSFLEGTHDFSSFTVERKNIDSAVRTIFKTDVVVFGPYICLVFTGDGFLYKMIRSVTGLIAPVGLGSRTPESVKTVLEAKDRCKAENTSPPNGLFLMKVYYKTDEWKNFRLEKPPFYW
jgi:tRNA pseudouridine38-40 synthase